MANDTARGHFRAASTSRWALDLTVGLLPALGYLTGDFEASVFDNLDYHISNVRWRELVGCPGGTTLGGRAHYAL
ncbi:MAG TPA: hypothetical protein VMZ31_20660 [Phycisphaerae bacterium]|nr:hypothetical protein [Phycisphaerae bacterium]